MAAGTAIGKIGKIDFFACLPSGTYAFLCLYLMYSIVYGLGEDLEKMVGCEFQKLSLNDDMQKKKIQESREEFESGNKKCAVLAVQSTDSGKWIIVRFINDNGFFEKELMDISSNELLKELEKSSFNERKIAELMTSKLDHGIWNAINKLIKKTSSEPTSLLLIIFIAYLLGSIFKAVLVKKAEHLSNHLNKMKESIFPEMQQLNSDTQDLQFPYMKNIIKQIERINGYANIPATMKEEFNSTKETIYCINSIKEEKEKEYALLAVYNYWKDIICINSPEAFVFFQEFEAKTRFFSTMVYSGITTMFFYFISLFVMVFKNGWHSLGDLLILLALSFIIVVVFGFNIRNVREQEAKVLTGLYLGYKQSTEVETKNKKFNIFG